MKQPFKTYGFTLSELLIALAIIGVIMTFTIPKVLESTQTTTRMATFKELITTIKAQAIEAGSNHLFDTVDWVDYFFDGFNTAKICSSNATTEGCWDAAQFNIYSESTEPGAILHSGATITGVKGSGAGTADVFIIDWNGAEGPNTRGEDTIVLAICIDPDDPSTNCPSYIHGSYTGRVRAGTIAPHKATDSTLFYEIFD